MDNKQALNELAINGGKPIRNIFLPYGKQSINDKDIDAVCQTLKSNFLTTGPKSKEFEEKLCNNTGAKYAIAFNSGTSALMAACYCAGFNEKHEVITTAMSFVATSNCLLKTKTLPVFCDIEKGTLNIDLNKIELFIKKHYTQKKNMLINKYTGRILKGFIPVHFAGHPIQMKKLKEIAQRFSLTIIEDAAHALTSSFYADNSWQKTGSCKYSDMTMFSFHPVKHITTGEGGAITTNNIKLYKKLQMYKSHGITRDREMKINHLGDWHYEMHFLGENYRMTDISASLGISQLSKSNQFAKKRAAIASKYLNNLANCQEIELPEEKKWAQSSWHIFVIKLKLHLLKADRNTIFNALRAENIGVNIHYIPIYHHPFYQKNKLFFAENLDVTENVFNQIITIPLFPEMKQKDIMDVINAIRKVTSYYAK